MFNNWVCLLVFCVFFLGGGEVQPFWFSTEATRKSKNTWTLNYPKSWPSPHSTNLGVAILPMFKAGKFMRLQSFKPKSPSNPRSLLTCQPLFSEQPPGNQKRPSKPRTGMSDGIELGEKKPNVDRFRLAAVPQLLRSQGAMAASVMYIQGTTSPLQSDTGFTPLVPCSQPQNLRLCLWALSHPRRSPRTRGTTHRWRGSTRRLPS